MTDYANILSALGKNPYQPQMDDLNRRSENFRIAEEMSSKGISLSDLTKRLGDLETKVGDLEKAKPKVDEAVFATMESAVSDNADVIKAKERLADAKADVILDLCMKDAKFREAFEEYKATVNRVYVESKERKKSSHTSEKDAS